MSKVITKGGYCSKRNKIMGFQFLGADGKFALGGSYGATGDIVASPEALPSELTVSPTYKGCKLCGNKYAYVCPACGTVVCSDGTAKNNASCPSCGSVLNISAVRGNLLSKPVLVRKASFKVNDGEASENGPYTKWAGVSKIEGAAADKFGNAQGSQYDLARDGAFQGYKVIVLKLYDYDYAEVDFKNTYAALRKKGFDIVEIVGAPDENRLSALLSQPKTQLWVVSGDRFSRLSLRALDLIHDYYKQGHGVYIWADNTPFVQEANVLLRRFYGKVYMSGDYDGRKVLGIQQSKGAPGIIANHPITTGLVSFYEGATISNIINAEQSCLTPLMYDSARKLLAAYDDKDGRRALVDGGWTRLYYEWGNAGTDRYLVNAAAWLTNVERFGY